MRHKVGEKVRIKSISWYNENKNPQGFVVFSRIPFHPDMSKYCDRIMTIDRIMDDSYRMKEDDSEWIWCEDMIEGLAKEDNPFDDNIPLPDSFVERLVHKISDSELFNVEPLDIPTMTTDFVKEYGLPCPDGYEFRDENGNVINTQKIVLEKKKKEYPKTYEECREILKEHADVTYGYKKDVLHSFQKLFVCRDAYWKLAGDWELSIDERFYYLYYNRQIDGIKKDYADGLQGNIILAFPTEEMRDAFYENFKELIEECKELL